MERYALPALVALAVLGVGYYIMRKPVADLAPAPEAEPSKKPPVYYLPTIGERYGISPATAPDGLPGIGGGLPGLRRPT